MSRRILGLVLAAAFLWVLPAAAEGMDSVNDADAALKDANETLVDEKSDETVKTASVTDRVTPAELLTLEKAAEVLQTSEPKLAEKVRAITAKLQVFDWTAEPSKGPGTENVKNI